VFKSRFFYLFLGISILVTLLVGINAAAVFADTTTTTTTTTPLPPNLTLTCDVPSYSDNSGAVFSYNVTMHYNGNDSINVKLAATDPTGWNSSLQYNSKEITSLPIGPIPSYASEDTRTIAVTLQPNNGVSPDPGSYTMTLKATSGQFNISIDLTAIVKDKYGMTVSTPDQKLNANATTGKVNNFSFTVQNTGTATLTNTTFTSSAPNNWVITFSPQSIATLAANQTQQVNVSITPPSGTTVAGDYLIDFNVNNAKVSQGLDIRFTVQSPSVWGVVSIIIIVVVIAGLVFLFLRLGRR